MKKIFLILSLALLAVSCVPKASKVVLNNQGDVAGNPNFEQTQSAIILNDWKTYQNEKYDFLFQYPAEKYLISHVDSDEYLNKLNRGVPQNLEDNSIWVSVSDFASLKRTAGEACDIAQKENPDDASCYFRSSSQEDFLSTEKTFENHSFINSFENKFGSNGPVNFLTVDGHPAIKQVVWSMNGEYYALMMRVFDNDHNLIELSLNLSTSVSRNEALEFLEGNIFKNVISSFKFIK